MPIDTRQMYRVRCDWLGCEATPRWAVNWHESREEAEDAAWDADWVHEDDEWFCPRCAEALGLTPQREAPDAPARPL